MSDPWSLQRDIARGKKSTRKVGIVAIIVNSAGVILALIFAMFVVSPAPTYEWGLSLFAAFVAVPIIGSVWLAGIVLVIVWALMRLSIKSKERQLLTFQQPRYPYIDGLSQHPDTFVVQEKRE